MNALGILLLIAAGVALLYRKDEGVLVPGRKTTTVNPWVVAGLAGLGLLCFYAGSSPSDSGKPPVNQGQQKEVQPVGDKPASNWPTYQGQK